MFILILHYSSFSYSCVQLFIPYFSLYYSNAFFLFSSFPFSCPPRTFLPALCHIFLDECAPDNILEVTARAITYYLDVSAECTRRIVAVDGTVKAICNRLTVSDVNSRTSKDLAEQCIKVRIFETRFYVCLFLSLSSSPHQPCSFLLSLYIKILTISLFMNFHFSKCCFSLSLYPFPLFLNQAQSRTPLPCFLTFFSSLHYFLSVSVFMCDSLVFIVYMLILRFPVSKVDFELR